MTPQQDVLTPAVRLPSDGARTVLFTLTGPDRPGVTTAVFGVLTRSGVEVLDVEQVVVRGHLTLAVLVTAGADEPGMIAEVRRTGSDLGLTVSGEPGTGDNSRRRRNRLAVTMLGAPLLPSAVAGVTGRIAAHGANIDRIRRISRYPVTTLELDISGGDAEGLRRELAAEAMAHGADLAVSPAGLARRGRRLVVMDVDSTLIQDEVIELLAAHAGPEVEKKVAEVTERAMRGELDFAASLHERVACLAGLPESVLDDVYHAVRLTRGARTLTRTLRRLGLTLGVVSGGFIEVVEPLARDLGIHHVAANKLEIADGRLTGRVTGPVVDRAAKAASLRRFAELEGLPLSRTVAIGDGANDLDMLATAGLGIAFCAKPVVREQADASVNVPYLDAVLYLLGIPRSEIEDADAAAEQPS
ncbi:phosphoserine phosphatase SerB [Kineosporia succinea]|uniref:phosphoserine phosphatase n=1 Tax=Kineosporia succinea TaxID=84632 RepID=A0ABT9P7C7_9ACTN|nr:phosphoserine phosphatase SerB [Kineosporia succinea]MDP9828594.1 phosphoserine phosphatase [Kineosporia succinea]